MISALVGALQTWHGDTFLSLLRTVCCYYPRASWRRIMLFWFNQRYEDSGWDQDLLFLFLVLKKGTRKRGEFEISLSNPRG